MPIIGIDLGTSNSLVSCFLNGEPTLIPNALGTFLTPSVVSVLDNDEIIVGTAAKERLITHPNRTVASFKRNIGTNKAFTLGKYKLTPAELSSFVLKSLKADAETFLGEPVNEAIISVPAYFNDFQRRETQEAALLAGLKVERLINEPTAAAVAYGLHHKEEDATYLVFDLGGGTFDVSIINLFEGILEVRAVAGDNFLGGDDFDRAIADYFLEYNNIPATSLSDKERSNLYLAAERCKRAFSTEQSQNITCEIDNQHISIDISLEQFSKICENLFVKLNDPIRRALKDCRITPNQLSQVILVGGSTKMKIVRSLVTKLFQRIPLSHINPEEVVGLGAGICAAMSERNEMLSETFLTDVCPYTLGIHCVSQVEGNYMPDVYSPIIQRNSFIPCSRVESYTTIHNYQNIINLEIYQGENPKASKNLKIGALKVNITRKLAGEVGVDVRFTYDVNGILEVEATPNDGSPKQSLIIQNSRSNLTPEEITKQLEKLKDIKIHPRENTKNQYLISFAERLYEEAIGETRNLIMYHLHLFESALARQDLHEINRAASAFEKFLNSLNQSPF